MNNFELSWDELKKKTYFGKPHVVILGAGASLAAFPDGDRYGSVLPLMNNLTEVLDLIKPLQQYGLDIKQNFEDIYSELVIKPELKILKDLVEKRVKDYFSILRLPDKPTIYDYLVLSLRDKDIIATFNWDPFLYRFLTN